MREGLIGVLVALVLLAGCGGRADEIVVAPVDAGTQADGSGTIDGGPPACVPGRSRACTCPAGEPGAQICDGTGAFGSCVCESLDAGPSLCVPGESAPCTCASGASGAQVCDSSGSFGACVCEPPDAGPPQCTPGESAPCTCANGLPGAQLCETSGSFGACVCEPPDAGPLTCTPGQSAPCTCVTGLPGAQICMSNGTYASCTCASLDGGNWEQDKLAWVKAGIVGEWVGTTTNVWEPPCIDVTVSFGASGYSAHSPGEACIVFYWGTNADSPFKTYDLNDVKTNGEVYGDITLYFSGGSTVGAEIRHLILSDDKQDLTFEVWRQTVNNPIVATLKRKN